MKEVRQGDAWMAQSVKHLTLDFGSGRDLTAHEFEPHVGLCADCVKLSCGPLSPSLSLLPPCLCSLSLSLKISK